MHTDQNELATDCQLDFGRLEYFQLNELIATFNKFVRMCNQTSTFVYQAGLLKTLRLCLVSSMYASRTSRSSGLFAG